MREDRLAENAKIPIVSGDLFLKQQASPAPNGRVIHFHDERDTELGQAVPSNENRDSGDGRHRDRHGHLQYQHEHCEEFKLSLRFRTLAGAGDC